MGADAGHQLPPQPPKPVKHVPDEVGAFLVTLLIGIAAVLIVVIFLKSTGNIQCYVPGYSGEYFHRVCLIGNLKIIFNN